MVSLSIEETAQAIIDIAVSGMYMEVSKLVSRYAIDPRDFVMQAFGGAGPMMACFLAKELGLQRVIIPATPGVLSALGGLIADINATSCSSCPPGSAAPTSGSVLCSACKASEYSSDTE